MNTEHQQLIHRIRASAAAIEQAVAALPAATHSATPQPGEWSVKQVLLHTRDVVMLAYGLRIRRLLFETDPIFTNYDEDEYRQLNPGDTVGIAAIVHMISTEHDLLAHVLSELPDDAWQRSGHNAEGVVRTIEFFAQRTAAHAEEHAAQIGALHANA